MHAPGTSTFDELNTPLAVIKGKGSAHSDSISGKTPCPKSARRKLVLTPTKTIEPIMPTVDAASGENNSIADSTTAASMPTSDDPALNIPNIVALISEDDKPLPSDTTKPKRTTAGTRTIGNAKNAKQ